MINLPIAHYRLTLRAKSKMQFFDYTGSMWRGALGWALKDLSCITQQAECKGCLFRAKCGYSYLFETQHNKNQGLKNHQHVPHPYIVRAPKTNCQLYQAGDDFHIELILFGHGILQAKLLLAAVQRVGEKGVGDKSYLFDVVGIEQFQNHDWQPWDGSCRDSCLPSIGDLPTFSHNTGVKLEWKSQVRLVHKGQLIKQHLLSAHDLLTSIVRRVSTLQNVHSDHSISLDYAALFKQAKQVKLDATLLHPVRAKRYSNRQKTRLSLDGFTGSVALYGAELADFLPWLYWGQWTHTGKSAVMGLGEYQLSVIHQSL